MATKKEFLAKDSNGTPVCRVIKENGNFYIDKEWFNPEPKEACLHIFNEKYLCKYCGEKYPPVPDNDKKESLSDLIIEIPCQGSTIKNVLKREHVTEKIQNAHKRLRTEMHLTLDNYNILDNIFKEEFGDKLNGTN